MTTFKLGTEEVKFLWLGSRVGGRRTAVGRRTGLTLVGLFGHSWPTSKHSGTTNLPHLRETASARRGVSLLLPFAQIHFYHPLNGPVAKVPWDSYVTITRRRSSSHPSRTRGCTLLGKTAAGNETAADTLSLFPTCCRASCAHTRKRVHLGWVSGGASATPTVRLSASSSASKTSSFISRTHTEQTSVGPKVSRRSIRTRTVGPSTSLLRQQPAAMTPRAEPSLDPRR